MQAVIGPWMAQHTANCNGQPGVLSVTSQNNACCAPAATFSCYIKLCLMAMCLRLGGVAVFGVSAAGALDRLQGLLGDGGGRRPAAAVEHSRQKGGGVGLQGWPLQVRAGLVCWCV